MKYTIYQICITDEEYAIIDAMDQPDTHPKYAAKRYHYDDVEQGRKDYADGLYTKVGVIEANDLEHVFHISNCPWDREELEPRITRLNKMHSVSVGDIIEDGNGDLHYCESYGFADLLEVA
jgi:hypothetical protein